VEAEPERARLDADLRARDPDWRVWRNGGLVFAWLKGTQPPVRFYATTIDGLRGQVDRYYDGGGAAAHGGDTG